MRSNGHYGFGVISYDPLGAVRWFNFWQDTDLEDAVPTSMGVDWYGNVYLSGVKWRPGFHGAKDSQFVVVKFRPLDGATVWPNSGTRTGFTFDKGGIILDSTGLRDGFFPVTGNSGEFDTEIWRCAIAVEDGAAGDQPTIAITGPSVNATGGPWVVAAFDYTPGDGIELKPGWPVHETNGAPLAIAIASIDHSIYVAGEYFNADERQEVFTTMRYSGAGTNMWIDQWEDTGKGGRALAVAADNFTAGTAYVTGYRQTAMGQPEPEVCSTRQIDTDPTTHAPLDVWQGTGSTYGDPTGLNRGTSISVSYERSGGNMTPYVYVTGLAEAMPNLIWDIATLRYNTGTGGGILQWTGGDRYSAGIGPEEDSTDSHPYYWPAVLAMGKGNAYVIGTQYQSSNDNYVFLGRTLTDGARFGTVSYDGANHHNDLGHALTIGGAGVLYYTGQSNVDGATNMDFVTANHPESPTNTTPYATTMSIWTGLSYNPDVSLVQNDDGGATYAQIYNSAFNPSFAIQVEFEGTVPTNATELSVKVAGSCDQAGVLEEIDVYNFRTSHWDKVSYMPTLAVNSPSIITLKDDPAEYMDANGKVKMLVTYSNIPALIAWSVKIDYVGWRTIS